MQPDSVDALIAGSAGVLGAVAGSVPAAISTWRAEWRKSRRQKLARREDACLAYVQTVHRRVSEVAKAVTYIQRGGNEVALESDEIISASSELALRTSSIRLYCRPSARIELDAMGKLHQDFMVAAVKHESGLTSVMEPLFTQLDKLVDAVRENR